MGSLRESAQFAIGTTFDAAMHNPNWDSPAKLTENYSRLTSENVFKMSSLYPIQGMENLYNNLRDFANVASRGNFTYHYHPFVWHRQLPPWLNSTHADSFYKSHLELGSNALTGYNFIDNLVGIDVVNEALLDNGSFRPSIWFEVFGKEYIFQAFDILTRKGTEAKLFYNDYNLILNPRKLDAALDLCDWVRKRGARVDGIGIQMHVNLYEPHIPELALALEKIWRRGYMVHISELDISLNPYGKFNSPQELDYQRQARVYRNIVRTYSKVVPKDYQYGITLWGFSDADSWIPNEFNRVDAPLLFDFQGNAKPAYCGFLDGLK